MAGSGQKKKYKQEHTGEAPNIQDEIWMYESKQYNVFDG